MSNLFDVMVDVCGGVADILSLGRSRKECLAIYCFVIAALIVIGSAIAIAFTKSMPLAGLLFALPIAAIFLVAGVFFLREED